MRRRPVLSGRGSRKIVLASPFGAMAHAVRCLSIGEHLHNAGFTVFVIGPKHSAILEWTDNFYKGIHAEAYPIAEAGGEPALDKSRFDFYSTRSPLKEFEELERILEYIGPDTVISDAYVLMPLVCEKLKLNHVGLSSAIWTNYCPLRRPIFRGDFTTRMLGAPFKQVIRGFSSLCFSRKIAYWAGPLNRIASEFGLKKRTNVLDYFEGNELTLITDIPEMGPLECPPDHVKYCGPIFWNPPFDSHHIVKLLDKKRKAIYVSFGSSQDPQLLEAIVGWLVELNYQVIMTLPWNNRLSRELTGNPDLISAELTNPLQILPHCEAALFHGGIGTVYQVLACGKPCIVVPFHVEQFWNGIRLEDIGTI